jgi:alpha-galactosidase
LLLPPPLAPSPSLPPLTQGLGQYIHSKGLSYSIYTAESTETCGGYPASQGYETIDAQTFADWGVDYIKVRECGKKGDGGMEWVEG